MLTMISDSEKRSIKRFIRTSINNGPFNHLNDKECTAPESEYIVKAVNGKYSNIYHCAVHQAWLDISQTESVKDSKKRELKKAGLYLAAELEKYFNGKAKDGDAFEGWYGSIVSGVRTRDSLSDEQARELIDMSFKYLICCADIRDSKHAHFSECHLPLSVIDEIMQSFTREKRVFTNEAQFQFELAMQLQLKGYRVLFEVPSVDQKGRKSYTDLVIDLGNKEYIAIELKYKTVEKPASSSVNGFDRDIGAFSYGTYKGIPQFIYPQGAVDEGSYNFLKDVERLERLVDKDIIFNYDEANEVREAYAIIIANSKRGSGAAYWADRSSKAESNSARKAPKWIDYNLGQERRITGKLASWSSGKRVYDSIKLNYKYVCNWEEFYTDDEKTDYPLKYLIFDIPGNE